MEDIPLGNWNEITRSISCEICKDECHYADELVFLLGEEVVSVSERYPDWDRALCVTCAEEQKII